MAFLVIFSMWPGLRGLRSLNSGPDAAFNRQGQEEGGGQCYIFTLQKGSRRRAMVSLLVGGALQSEPEVTGKAKDHRSTSTEAQFGAPHCSILPACFGAQIQGLVQNAASHASAGLDQITFRMSEGGTPECCSQL